MKKPCFGRPGVAPSESSDGPGIPRQMEMSLLHESMDIIDRILVANRSSRELDCYRDLARKGHKDWTIDEGGRLLFGGNRLAVPDEEDLRTRILDEIHRQPSTSHPGKGKMRSLLKQRYWWPSWSADADRYVDHCLVCRRVKTRHDLPPGLLQPLPIPSRPWQHISMDFRSFPKSRNGYDAALVVVDRLGKRGFAIPCHKTTTAKDMAHLFLTHVYPWVGLPDSIVSDRGGQFISDFWDELCRILRIRVKLSSGQHPQTNGQTEVMNQWIAQRLRPYVDHYQDDWDEYLPMVNFASAALPSSTGVSPFLVERGYEPRVSFNWLAASPPSPQGLDVNREQAQTMVKRMQEVWEFARSSMARAQELQKRQADKGRREVDFDVGDEVMVTTRDWNTGRPSRKLSDQWSGPYRVIEKVGHSYRLDLPPNIKVHPVFAPEKLRAVPRTLPLEGQVLDPALPVEVDGEEEWEVEEVVASRQFYGRLQYRVRWVGYDIDLEWYPARLLRNAPVKVQAFHTRHPTAPGPPKRLNLWLSAAEDDVFLDYHPDDDRPARDRPNRRRAVG